MLNYFIRPEALRNKLWHNHSFTCLQLIKNSWRFLYISQIIATIGVCVKNSRLTIGLTIKSILNQNFPHGNMEVIVVDGYSSDGSFELIKRQLSTSDIKSTFFSENTGLGFARQVVVDNAKGKYVIWVDGDMVLPPNHVKKQVAFIDANPSVGIGRSRYGIWPASGTIAFLENIPFVIESLKFRKEVPIGICGTEGAIHRVAAMRQVGGFNVNIQGAAEDTDLARRILHAGWKACATEAVFYELCKESWRDLWNQYLWWGKGWHLYFHKENGDRLELLKLSPLGGIISGSIRIPLAYVLTHRKILFLLPFHYFFKRIAFCVGITKAHQMGYGH